ncbi:1-deoxy-D-xylulose-5-phosphate synthase [Acetivibrio mesophilus]|uniref:1-deoxy-D-xylulose-5-phosphate synthase n=1 Tax=Acetivibrio mesophilus TaxID=2487273 RepID=A0A4Q0I7L9_9FIRM|nr:1-deoxy-D-xylulose-5-phosphate synthase [Acetivibrio mesophilus]RXE59865.1 1-deoxy-D-xylulose-5-phosphate synthase [Acetivibrio mesophilus]HHV28613.1 1-deoxy-D-xylulose-5-phosphate synthase [Clostridium sp.]
MDNINSSDDIKKLNLEQIKELGNEIRSFLIEKVSKTGGHLASNLGVVELTLALHRVFNTPEDKIIWDVGHQSYVHKIITGRKDKFDTIRKLGGLSGFPKSMESEHDAFNTGHSSTSISAALGIAKARDLKKEKHSVIAVIGDGALTGGMAFEALNDAGSSPNNLIVVLNDNEMSISRNVGGLSCYLSKIRTEPFYFKVKEDIDIILNKIPAIGKSAVKALDRVKGTIKYMIMPGILFEELGFKYLGPIDGHNIAELENVLTRAKNTKGPVLVHVCTQKGRGYTYAEENPAVFHGISPFEIETGEVIAHKVPGYSDAFGREIVRIAQKDERVVALTAAMPHGTGLDKFSKTFPERFFDVGIAEQHAVTFGAGLAKNGMIPVIALYSSFLQRAYDQVVHDVALQNLHVVFAIDRAGIVGEDGETHQGIYDISFLRHIPNMAVVAPCDYNELAKILEYAVLEHDGPIAIRYPRGAGAEKLFDTPDVKLGQSLLIGEGGDVTIAAVGNKVGVALEVAEKLKKVGLSADVIYCRFIKPLDSNTIINSIQKTKRLVTIEDNTIEGGFGSRILETINQKGINVKTRMFGYPDAFIPHGSTKELTHIYRLDPDSIFNDILKEISKSRI